MAIEKAWVTDPVVLRMIFVLRALQKDDEVMWVSCKEGSCRVVNPDVWHKAFESEPQLFAQIAGWRRP